MATTNIEVNKALFKAVESGNIEEVKEFIREGADVNATDRARWTPLHFASARGYEGIVDLLIEKGAKVDAKDTSGWTPLWLASNHRNQRMMQLLKHYGAKK